MPTVVVTTTGFSAVARLTAKAKGVDGLRVAEYPGPVGIHDEAVIRGNVEAMLLASIIAGLTDAGAEARPAQPTARTERTLTGPWSDLQSLFDAREWTDGLPIVPPTLEHVAAFLQFSPRPPDGLVAVLPSANLAATPRNIAANGVMAGCSPEHMPLLLAAVEALGDERCALGSLGSTSGIVPFMIVNGPIVEQLGIAHGAQLVSRGPNPALGRALGLIVRNIAGFRPGGTYMGTFGCPIPFTLAESTAATPWEPFHVTQGFAPGDNAVTIGVSNNWGASPAAYETADQTAAETALQLLAREITHKTRLFNFPARGPDAETVMITLMVSPSIARTLAAAGYSKRDVLNEVFRRARMPLREFDWVLRHTAIMRTTSRERVEMGIFPPEFKGQPDDIVHVLSSPDVLSLVVCGDPARNRVMVMEGGHTRPTTRKIDLVHDWEARLARRSGNDA